MTFLIDFQSADRLLTPVRGCNVLQDLEILKNLVRRMDNNDVTNAEQLLPDFYAEHVTLAMNRERRKQALVRVLHLIRQDVERERRGREGLETLHRAFIKTPAFAADESAQNVTDKLHHVRLSHWNCIRISFCVSGFTDDNLNNCCIFSHSDAFDVAVFGSS